MDIVYQTVLWRKTKGEDGECCERGDHVSRRTNEKVLFGAEGISELATDHR